jgi:dihydroxy-acid dehydratase
MTMGTASTMACMAEALGIALSSNATWPAVDARRNRLARLTGRRAVELVQADVRPSAIHVKSAFENAIRVNAAIGGSTNAVVHLLAIAGRLGVDLDLNDWDRAGRGVPTILDLMPAGSHLMEDFCYAGGLPALMKKIGHLLERSVTTVDGRTLGEIISDATCFDDDVIRDPGNPIVEEGGIAVLRGNIAPGGAIIKPSAASPHLMRHRGRALVFETIEEFHRRIDDPELDVDENSVLVLKGAGPIGYPGMAEVGNMALPKRLLARGIRDMVRISDGRMSGTAFGTVVLHVVPEAAAGGPFALVRSGDMIELDVEKRLLNLEVSAAELDERRALLQPPQRPDGGYERLYVDHVLQADRGADLDFLVGCRGAEIPRESH